VVLLDTNVLSEVLRPRPSPAVIGRLLQFTSKTLFASEVTRFELRFGSALRPDASLFWARIQQDLLTLVTWLPVSEAVSMRAGDIAAAQRLAGRPCGTLDPLIAATALTKGVPLATRNVQHFARIDGLEVQNWFDPPAG
jgi:predicted nucleic acid-binding protein